ncbi:MAG: hypothetical protein V3U62_03100 [Sedimenticolaceae bacterium]
MGHPSPQRAAAPHHRFTLRRGYAALPQMAGRRTRKPTLLPLLRYRTLGKQCDLTATGVYRPSLRSTMAGSADTSIPT